MSSSTTSSPYSAASSAVGYLYQVRYALLHALKRLRKDEGFLVSLEALDDVAFESVLTGKPIELIQTKHHLNREANLTDSSTDLWKTLRIWFEGHAAGTIPAGTSLFLLTTGQASAGSSPAYLCDGERRDLDAALQSLEATARTSTSTQNSGGYVAFLAADPKQRRLLLSEAYVVDAAPTISDLETELKSELFYAVQREHQDVFLEYLEGWWFGRVIKQLTTPGLQDRILSDELEAQMTDLREQFKQDSLPISTDLINFDLDEKTKAAYAGYPFVQQLELIEATSKRISYAVRDYHRAYEQRSRWLRQELLMVGDISTYEKRLVEEWEIVFEAVKNELPEDAVEDLQKQAARKVLEWAEKATILIRPNVTEPFVCRGSLHMLADDKKVGWHPDFLARIRTVLERAVRNG